MSDVKMTAKREWRFDLCRTSDDVDWPVEMPVQYSSVGRMFRPETLTFDFSKRGDEPVKFDKVRAYGPRILKGGKDGEVVDQRWYFPPQDDWILTAMNECLSRIRSDLDD